MSIQILKETPQHLVIHLEDGRVDTVINDGYSKLKYGTYKGNRIMFNEFGEGFEITETYDDRIFNCNLKNTEGIVQTIQFRDNHSNELAKVIEEKTKEQYVLLYKSIYFEKHKTELLNDLMVNSYDGRVVAQTDGSFVIDNVFMINSHGQAYFISSKRAKNPQWSNLCIVVKGRLLPKIMQTKVGAIEFDTTLLTIMYKIDYLVSPTLIFDYKTDKITGFPKIVEGTGKIDNVFMAQLPNWLQKQVELEVFGKIIKNATTRRAELGDGNA